MSVQPFINSENIRMFAHLCYLGLSSKIYQCTLWHSRRMTKKLLPPPTPAIAAAAAPAATLFILFLWPRACSSEFIYLLSLPKISLFQGFKIRRPTNFMLSRNTDCRIWWLWNCEMYGRVFLLPLLQKKGWNLACCCVGSRCRWEKEKLLEFIICSLSIYLFIYLKKPIRNSVWKPPIQRCSFLFCFSPISFYLSWIFI